MAIANVTGSVGFTSYNRPAMTRVAASAATLPRGDAEAATMSR